MRIGQLAKQTGIPVETLRYWEKQQLLSPNIDALNGYRNYSQQDIHQLAFIQSAKAVGFSLNEIRDLLTLRINPENHSCRDVKSIAIKKLEAIEQKIAELEAMRRTLKSVTDICCGGEDSATKCSILNSLDNKETS